MASWVKRLALTSTSLGAIAVAPQAQAAVMRVSGSPVSLSINDGPGKFKLWDVDGMGGADFALLNVNYFYNGFTNNYLNLVSYGLNGAGLVGLPAPGAVFARQLSTGFVVGPGAGFGPGNATRVALSVYTGVTNVGYQFPGFQAGGVDNYFGFQFYNGNDLHYGYGIIQFDLPSKSVTISSWAYESSPDTALTVPAPMGLAGLAAGAAWTRRLRRRIRSAQTPSLPQPEEP